MMSHSCIVFGSMFVLLTVGLLEGTITNEVKNIIGAFPDHVRSHQQYDIMDYEPLILPVKLPIEFTLLNNPTLRHSLTLKYPGISFDLDDLDIEKDNQQKRHMSLMNSKGQSNTGSIRKLLMTYFIRPVKRDPEIVPTNMFPVQAGKQQLEVDLDNEFDEEDNGINVGEDVEMSGINTEMNGKESDMNTIENDKLDSYLDEASHDSDLIGVPAHAIVRGIDLSETYSDERSEYIDDNGIGKGFRNKLSGLRKRFWGARSVYKLRIPKTKSDRSIRTRTALPLVDPMLFYIGLGK